MNRAFQLMIRGASFAAFALGAAACHDSVTSHALVKPTPATGEEVLHLLRGEPTDPDLRFVYGYWPGGATSCDVPHATPSDPHDRYGALVCKADKPLSVAYFVNSWHGTSRVPDDETNERLAYILTDTLVPVRRFSRP